jgi:hypothetical protein
VSVLLYLIGGSIVTTLIVSAVAHYLSVRDKWRDVEFSLFSTRTLYSDALERLHQLQTAMRVREKIERAKDKADVKNATNDELAGLLRRATNADAGSGPPVSVPGDSGPPSDGSDGDK